MKTRQFSLAPLLKQLQVPAVKTMLLKHGGSRIFESREIDCIYMDAKVDSDILLAHLLKTPDDKIDINDDKGYPQFATDCPTRQAIENWAKTMMNHAANELLTTDNEILPELKKLLAKAPGELTAATLVLSFFSYNSMYIYQLLEQRHGEELLDLLIAYNDCIKDASIWSKQVLEARMPGLTKNEQIGVGAGIVGGLVLVGLFGAFALATFNQNNNTPRPKPPGNH